MQRLASIFLLGLACGWIATLALRGRAQGDSAPPAAEQAVAGSATAASAESNGDLPPRRAVVALGTIEPRDGVIQIGSPLAGCQVRKIHVQEGQIVKVDDLLVELDPCEAEEEFALASAQLAEAQEQQQARIELANERVASALLAVEHARSGRPLEMESQQSRIAVAAAKHKQALADVEYFEKLRKLAEPLATEQQLEHQRLLLEAAAAELEAARVASKHLEQTLTFRQQTSEAELDAARQSLAIAERERGVDSFKRRVALADLKRRQTRLTAPTAGVVLSVAAHPGELVAQMPLVELADLDHLICTAEVEAGDVPYLKNAQQATVECRAFRGSRLKGRIDRVGKQVALATLRPLDPRKPVDRDVAKVIVTIDAQEAARLMNTQHADHRAALVGLQVEVSFPMNAQPDKSAF